ncbi:hypothetical protein H5410_004659 [Solanum commersonii]|uniref:Uncharacterized protein n=1 Tax=Solanum commersonii TaxID=4109 RepID=A0A9J6B8D7_SOLCO|nr:hypothetical protein H5410_004659 [Solanum commersonii]
MLKSRLQQFMLDVVPWREWNCGTNLEEVACNTNCPWMVGGDFNTIVDESEKLGGLPVSQVELEDFNTKVQHLIREGSDHAPLHVTCSTGQEQIYKPFRFLNFWTKHHSLQKIVEDVWKMEATGSPFTVVQTKIKRVKLALVQWSRTTFGNIFQHVATLEDLIRAKEVQLEINASEENRTTLKKFEADLKKYLHIEEEYWKQKASMRWFKDGDRNTKFFHAFVNRRRRKMQISVIKTRQGDTITTTQKLGKRQ